MREYGPITQNPVRFGAQIQPGHAATTVRVLETLFSDGPFADTKEVCGGFYFIDVPNLDEALAFASRIPSVRLGGAVEVQPVVER
jgi:hypothetical protein